MLNAKISSNCAAFIVNCGKKDAKERPIYEYGISILLSSFITITITLVIGIITNYFVESLFFVIMFCSLRMSIGGYHAPNGALCKGMFIVAFIVTILSYNVKVSPHVLEVLLGVGFFVIVYYAPVGTRHNPIPEIRKIGMKKRGIVKNLVQLSVLYGMEKVCYQLFYFGALAVLLCETILIVGVLMYRGE